MDLVLSDVHVGAAPSAAQLCTTLFRFRDAIGRGSCSGDTCDRSSDGCSAGHTDGGRAASAQLGTYYDADSRGGPTGTSAAAAEAAVPMQTDEDGDVIVKRRQTGADVSDSNRRQPCTAGGSNSVVAAADGIVVHHAMATSLNDVGKQVWRGALLLADLSLGQPELVAGTVVELGAGCGVAGIAAALAGAKHVLLTDLASVTPALEVNVQANAAGFAAGATCVTVHSLDWNSVPRLLPCCFHSGAAETDASSHTWQQWAAANGWSAADLKHLLHAEVLMAADCVYDNDLTDAFMAAAAALLQPPAARSACGAAASPAAGTVAAAAQTSAVHPADSSISRPADARSHATSSSPGSCAGCSGSRKRMYVALEKRYNFTLRDADVRASAYEHWLTLFRQQHGVDSQQPPALVATAAATAAAGHPLRSSGNRLIVCERSSGSAGRRDDGIGLSCGSKGSDVAGRQGMLVGRRLDVVEVAQVLEYERGPDLELWELWAA